MMLLVLIAVAAASATRAAAMEQHCLDPVDCPFYPVHSCFATERGLICQNRNMGGFELNPNPVETFVYSPYRTEDDTGEPCITIPLSDELYSYVDYRGPEVIDQGDLDLIGNCSRLSYCDPKTRTCQPKRNVGSSCRHNMECFFGMDVLPGHCANHSVCAVREDLPPYYGAGLHQWKLGDQWKSAALAVIATGAVVVFLVVGRQQVGRLFKALRHLIQQWRQQPPTVPGLNWVYKRFNTSNRDDGAYYPLQQTTIVDEQPPAYRE
ncbi:hypothetical protein O0I10_005597 [Lichtheimia ornata]|uniref:Uncharacterized protein n=1 Tax=Lichtheimia ornata TaxID=688661 RepID=A0AAD7V3V8_9FUNG|nr:uncharacterized protein O0I10_005597 [Lichtheimia ornata]KAJ8658557.1 hypothetical protein O0I10_005597 [Lichtheimia ornata]